MAEKKNLVRKRKAIRSTAELTTLDEEATGMSLELRRRCALFASFEAYEKRLGH